MLENGYLRKMNRACFSWIILFFTFTSIPAFAQWTVLNIPSAGRFDDISFVNDSVGWVAAGNTYRVFKTVDGGDSWSQQLVIPGDYFRSIGFANERLGFCGSLAGGFYRTRDGGDTWTNIAPEISPSPPGICGISVPDSNHIYASGKWKGPAFVLKSSDGGNSFTSIDLSALAGGFNEILFINKDTGFVAGKSPVPEEGGVILRTTDGGEHWQVVHKTNVSGDYVWKIQSPDSIHFYASVEGLPSSGNLRMLVSSDRGQNWETRIIRDTYYFSQVVGFMDTLRGWTGGKSILFETSDGGSTWTSIPVGVNYNRFRRVNSGLAFLSGDKIYRFKRDYPTQIAPIEAREQESHTLTVYPVPVQDSLKIDITLNTKTDVLLWLIDSKGRIVSRLFEADYRAGSYHFAIPKEQIPDSPCFVILKTNSGIQYKELVK